MKVKITEEILNKLEIIDKLRRQKNQLDCTRTYELEELAGRLVCSPELLYEVLESMGVVVVE